MSCSYFYRHHHRNVQSFVQCFYEMRTAFTAGCQTATPSMWAQLRAEMVPKHVPHACLPRMSPTHVPAPTHALQARPPSMSLTHVPAPTSWRRSHRRQEQGSQTRALSLVSSSSCAMTSSVRAQNSSQQRNNWEPGIAPGQGQISGSRM